MDYGQKLIEDIVVAINEAIETAKMSGERSACTTAYTDDGYVDVWIDDEDNCEAVVCNDTGREHPLLEQAICDALPHWEDIHVQYDEDVDGFGTWDNYNRWRYC